MFADYQALVLQTYHAKKASNELLFNLSHPTAARLKAECICVCEKRYHRKDETLFRSFFGPQDNAEAYRNAIKKTDADRFRPLVIYLKHRDGRNTSEKNIELLAWLIDFERRPYRTGESYAALNHTIEPVSAVPDKSAFDQLELQPHLAQTPSALQKSKKIRLLTASAVIFSIVVYFVIKQVTPSLNGGCMYWDNDHYQPTSCHQQDTEIHFSPIDLQKVAHFKRITQPDTLTPHSLGSVWYIKINGRIEFYTAKGSHPVDTNRHLMRLTSYILNKYVYHVPDH